MSIEWLVIPVALGGAMATYVLHHDYGFPAVRASAAATLVFVGATWPVSQPLSGVLQAAFFGASFTGMCAADRFTRLQVAICGFVYALVYLAVLSSPAAVRAPGGVLGTSAFVAGVIVVVGEALRVRFFRRGRR